jgi:hypothetical protein
MISFQSKAQEIKKFRLMFFNASQNLSDANIFYNYMKNVSVYEGTTSLGYKAMSEFMKCYHSFNPLTKLEYYNKAKTHLVIQEDPVNIELRYLRFSVQVSIPSILGYKQNIEADKSFLIENLWSVETDEMLYDMIRTFLLESSYCSDDEKEKIQKSI